jgi:hypothetical protein
VSVSPTQTTLPVPQARRQLRLRLKPAGSASGYVDGAWWPRSRDLPAELPALADVLTVRLGSVWQVVYPFATWQAAPRRTQLDGHPVRLEGFHSQDENTISIVTLDRQRVRLLVIPLDASEKAGHDAMMTAAARDNTDSPATILTTTGARTTISIPARREAHEDAKGRWEGDGGHINTRHDL